VRDSADSSEATGPIKAAVSAGVAGALDAAAIIDLVQSVSGEVLVERIVNAVVNSAVRHLDAARASLVFPDDATDWRMDALVDRAVETRQMASADACSPAPPIERTEDVSLSCSRTAVPLLRGEALIGVLCLEFAAPSYTRSAEQLFLTELLASQAARSLEQALRHERDAREDHERRQSMAESERVQSALRESDARFRLMAENTPDIIWITQLEPEQVVYASPSFERIFGRKVVDLYANPHLWIEGIHPDDRERVGASFGAWIASGSASTWEIEFRVVQPNGDIRWLHDRGVFISESGGPRRVSGIATDITERRLAAAALRESEQRYALAMDAARDGHWDWIAETDHFYASPRMLEIYGFPPETHFLGRLDFINRFPFYPEDEPRWRIAAHEHFTGSARRFDFELRLLRAGEIRWIRTTGLIARDAHGRPTRYTGSVSDITTRKASEAALRASEQRFALVVAGSTDGIWDWDMVTDEMFLSERAQQLYGLAPGSDVRPRARWRAATVFHPDDGPVHDKMLEGYLAGQLASYDVECRVLHADGSYRWLRLRGICVRDAAGMPCRMAGSVNDVDLRRRAEAALQQAQRLEALGTLAGGIAHDFNNLLGAILGFGEMALRDSRLGSRVRRDVEGIMTAGGRGRSLVERILAFSRTGVGERVPIRLESVVKEAVDMISAGMPRDLSIRLELNSGLAATLGDAMQLHQVVMNLAANAMQAMTRGVVRVTLDAVRLDESLMVTTGTVPIGDHLVLSVCDSGCGIPPEVLSRIFDPFFTTKDVGAGTGLGLSIVHGIVSELGGSIDVITSVESGSAFTVYLPRCGDAADAVAAEAVSLQRGQLEQVLLVDDEEALVQLMSSTLLDLGYVPVGFSSGIDALAAFTAHPDRFDAVVTDARMPGLSGTDLIAALRKVRPAIPVVMVSGYLGADIELQARQAGAVAVLRKPLVVAELASALSLALHGSANAVG
jgi:PAS domain S-box-containing protein